MAFTIHISTSGPRTAVRCVALALAAASLAACAQSSVVTQRSGSFAPTRQAARDHDRASRFATGAPVSVVRRQGPADGGTSGPRLASQGLASFYNEGGRTASGERFDSNELTAAHPTLPFGTRLRVTNVANGQSVTVRVNDRGPFVPGRVVDVSHSAAQALGMVRSGTANVRLDVVR